MIHRISEILDKIPELPFFIAAGLYMALAPQQNYAHIFSAAFVFIALSLFVGITLKLAFKTKRPKELTKNTLFKYGLPSLHAMIGVGAIGFVYFVSKTLAFILLPVGLLFMASRVELHYHARRDVLVGAALGLFLGWVSGKYFLATPLPQNTELAFAILFFATPTAFSVLRFKHRI